MSLNRLVVPDLSEVLCVELPEVGESMEQGYCFGSVQTLTDNLFLFMPFSGLIVAVNPLLESEPGAVLDAPELGWLLKVKVKEPSAPRRVSGGIAQLKH